MKKKLFLSMTGLLMATALIGGATFAEFSSQQTSTGSTFTAGTLVMAMTNDKDTNKIWETPSNWAPGQTVTNTVKFTNTGSIDANHIYFNFNNLQQTKNMARAINVTNVSEKFNGVDTGNQVTTLATQVGDGQMPLTLAELASTQYYTWDDKSTDGKTLAAGDQKDYELTFDFQFDPAAGNEYQGATAGFDFTANATQNSPTEGYVKLHQ